MEPPYQFDSHSQAGQDLFVARILEWKRNGFFLDVGASHPSERSNTWALEGSLGWQGICVDNNPDVGRLFAESGRRALLIEADATKIDPARYASLTPKQVDYLSLDVDSATTAALQRLPLDARRFSVITVEHDRYRFGPGPQEEIRDTLFRFRYRLICADVHADGLNFEDWWIDPEIVPDVKWAPFASVGKSWTDILGLKT